MNPTLSLLPPVVVPADLELIDEFIDLLERDAKTLHKYRQHLLEFRAFLDTRAGGAGLLEIGKPQIKLFLADLRKGKRSGVGAGGEPRAGALGESSRKCVLAALRAFYVHCFDMYGYTGNPTFGLKAPRPKPKRGVSLDEKQLKAYLDAPGKERDRVQAYLQVFTAARTMSFRHLRWEDIDTEQNLIHFNAKFENDYTLPIHPQLKAALFRWREAVEADAKTNTLLRIALQDPETAYVLLTRNGCQLAQTTIAKQAKWRANRVGLLRHHDPRTVGRENKSRVSPHAFRRSRAQQLRSKGVDLADIADLLNHKDVNTTRLHYAYTDTPKLRKTVMAMSL